jgi:chemotaxis protein methyltransferase CheR
VRKFVQQGTGIAIRDDQDYILVSRMTPLLRRAELESIGALVQHLKHRPSLKLQQQLIEAITNHETSFFRDIHQFETLKDDILPELIQRNDASKRLNIWSAACATGQEPYSVAMVLHRHFPQLARWNVNFIASDISHEALRNARNGRYSQIDVNRGLPAQLLVRHFSKVDATWQLDDVIRKHVDFRQINLIEPLPQLPQMDIVFLRNALIYFDDEVKRRVLRKIHDVLTDGGYLLLGVGESPRDLVSGFECTLKKNTVYFQKRLAKGDA